MGDDGAGSDGDRWLSASFEAPARLELPTGHHLRQLRVSDVALDHATVMANQHLLYEELGPVWGWPPADMTIEDDRADLERHVQEMAENESFVYGIFDEAEGVLAGCVYVDPPERVGADVDVSWWVVADERGGPLERAVRRDVPHWIRTSWPFEDPRFLGLDLTWAEWLELPEADEAR